ncbi:MAG: hypothetical protein JKY81_05565 [Colwellia sp.]|nr:hypothetical protein [Colwellia sp.]
MTNPNNEHEARRALDAHIKLRHEAADLRMKIYKLQKKNDSMIVCAMVIGSIMISWFIFT